MFDCDDYGNVTFTHNETVAGVNTHVAKTINGTSLTYDLIVDQFALFLQQMGYTYIGGLAVLDQNGNEIYSTLD